MEERKVKNVLLPKITAINEEVYSLEKNIDDEDYFNNVMMLNCDIFGSYI